MEMKKLLLLLVLLVTVACSESLEDRAAREAKEFTTKLCPTPYVNYERTDSCVFDENAKMYVYYMSLRDKADNKVQIDKHIKQYRNILVQSVTNNTKLAAYKKEHFSFRYIFRSAKTGDVLIDETITSNDYK